MKKNHARTLLLLLALSILLAGSFALAVPYEKKVYTVTQPIVDPKPLIKVNFGENPVTIASNQYGLYVGVLNAKPATGGFDVGCVATTDTSAASTNYTFRLANADSYLLNGPYTFYAYALDADGNVKEVFVTFTIKAPVPDVCLVAPLHDSQASMQCGRFGMSRTRTFDLSFRINSDDIPAKDCKLDFVDYLPPGITSVNTDPSILYSSFRTTVNSTDGKPAFAFSVKNFSGLKNLNIPSGKFTRVMVVCKDANGAFSLSQPPLELGWDDTAPLFTAKSPTFSPTTVRDPSYKTSTLSVTTDDDTFCTYVNIASPPSIGQYVLPLASAPTRRGEYNSSKKVAFSFNSLSPQAHGFTPYPFTFRVDCSNAAGLSRSANATVTVQFDDAIVITKRNPPSSTRLTAVPFNFTTNLYANCQLFLNNTVKANTSGMVHSKTLTLTQGSHNYRIDCTQLMYPAASLSGKVTIDTVPPVAPNITEWTKVLCGSDKGFEAVIATKDRTVDVYNYTIVRKQGNFSLQGDIESKGESTSLRLVLGKLVPGSTYTLTVKAIDQAGNVGPAKAVDFTTKPAGDISCDTLAPQTSAVLESKPSVRRGYNITVSCKDESGGSGCQAQGRYLLVALGASCPANVSTYTTTFPVNKTFLLPVNKTVCWSVSDNAMNKATGKKDLPLPLAADLCGNRDVEPGEQCDTTTALTCSTLGFTGGNLTCSSCRISTAKCLGTAGVCGDNVTNVGESCDGSSSVACRVLMPYYPDGKVSCTKCSLDTSSCKSGAVTPPQPPANATCTPACGVGKVCRAGVCVAAVSGNTTPPRNATCSPACGAGKVCTAGVCKDVIYPPQPEESHTLGVLLLIFGILFLLGGIGYLIYTVYFPPYSPAKGFSSSMPLPPQPSVSPEEAERRRAVELSRMKERLSLQEQAHQKTMREKERQRKDIINSFKEDHFVKKGAKETKRAVPPAEGQKAPVREENAAAAASLAKKTPEKPKEMMESHPDINALQDVAEDDGKTDPFEHLAALTGASKTRVKNALSKDEVTGKDVAGLFKDKERVTAKDVTPALRRALDEELIDEEAAQDTLESLQDTDKLSEAQKRKILKDLEIIGKE